MRDASENAIEHVDELSSLGAGATHNQQDGVPADHVSGVAGVHPKGLIQSEVTAGETSVAEDVTDEVIPSLNDRPKFVVVETMHQAEGQRYRPGVWFFGVKAGRDKAPPTPIDQWVCGPLWIRSVTRDLQDNNYGRLLEFQNTSGRYRQWAMPMDLLSGRGDEMRAALLSMGLQIDVQSHRLLAKYLQDHVPKKRMLCAMQVGWCGDSFVLPHFVTGPSAAGITFQSSEQAANDYGCKGSFPRWREEISHRAVGNPLLMVAISAAFAGPLLSKCKAEGGGIHLVGDSSSGKTTAIEAACSVWGGPTFKRSWRTTANGMEGAAALFNDGLLALDEISECDPRDVGAIIYALGNGAGKQRANRSGAARSVTRWRCMVLSSGERTISTSMSEGGQRAKAGQAVRLLDIPAVRRFGAWDELHNMPNGMAFSDAIKRAATAHFGHAGLAFLKKLAFDKRDFCKLLDQIRSDPRFAAIETQGQEKRAASRLSLVALAGEMATAYGITGWAKGDATNAAVEALRAWGSLRGPGNDEQQKVLDQVSSFIDRHTDSRFSNAESSPSVVRDRAGWWEESFDDGRLYLFTTAGMREALLGFDFKRGLDILQSVQALVVTGAGERAKPRRLDGRPVRVYQIRAEKLTSN